jgi:hypothetical protein
MLVDVCTFVGLVILYLVYDWYAVRRPAVPAARPGGRNHHRGKVAIGSRASATRLTLVPGRKREQPVGEKIRRGTQQRAS